ncbi:retrovirus-related pol polyprotein from transposon tnt 1-94 [Lasius niger]|uniref:Retrovirus-related pol polyprotein from transposon tnt 1-94 n=1 Tax=Lasius niger TaxID=67767 RepID=A0A0J7N3H6_LASNI|nr:retrovirus-related pol polyprotein from transposon tnt 1-94 [Lasius niger]
MAEVGVQNLGQIEKLIGRENYGTWKFAMRACLEAEDLWGCVLGEEAYVTDMKKMTKARAKIVLVVQKQNYGHIQSANTPRQAWENLKNAFEDKGLTRKVGLLRILTSTKFQDCNSVEEYVNMIMTTAHTLKELDFEVKDEMIGALLLSGLPDEYRPMIMGLESSGTAITADAIKVKILQEVKHGGKQSTETEAALYSKARATRKKSQDKVKGKCFACGKTGHFAAKCRNKARDDNKEKDSSTHKVFATFAQAGKNDEWYLDSGASTHMTGWSSCLKDMKKCDKTITAANRGQLKAVAHGVAEIGVTVNGGEKVIRVENVLYVPGLAANLLSVGVIVQRDYKVTITKNGCTIHDADGELTAVAKSTGGVYKLHKATETALATTETDHRGGLWHRRMGHLGRGGMKQLIKGPAKSIRKFEATGAACDICVKSKLSRQPFKHSGIAHQTTVPYSPQQNGLAERANRSIVERARKRQKKKEAATYQLNEDLQEEYEPNPNTDSSDEEDEENADGDIFLEVD